MYMQHLFGSLMLIWNVWYPWVIHRPKYNKLLGLSLFLSHICLIWIIIITFIYYRDNTAVEKLVAALNVKVLARDMKSSDSRALLKAVMSQWLPISTATLGKSSVLAHVVLWLRITVRPFPKTWVILKNYRYLPNLGMIGTAMAKKSYVKHHQYWCNISRPGAGPNSSKNG